jgi:hypothetical protein
MTETDETKIDRGVYHYNPVQPRELIGTSFLGIIVIILLVALLRSQARVRTLLQQNGVSQETGDSL